MFRKNEYCIILKRSIIIGAACLQKVKLFKCWFPHENEFILLDLDFFPDNIIFVIGIAHDEGIWYKMMNDNGKFVDSIVDGHLSVKPTGKCFNCCCWV